MTRGRGVEWDRRGSRVKGNAPTWVRTPLIRPITENPEVMKRIEEITPMGRIAEPEELVGAVLFLASRASAMVTGHVLAVDGGFLAPEGLTRQPVAHLAASGGRTSIAQPKFRRPPSPFSMTVRARMRSPWPSCCIRRAWPGTAGSGARRHAVGGRL